MARPEAIPAGAPLKAALEMFRRHPSARFLAVVDAERRPVGAMHERMVRELLFSPFGHSLLDNPAYNRSLGTYLQPCPSFDILTPAESLIEGYARVRDAEGIILTRDGLYEALLPSKELLGLAAQVAIERGRRLEQAFGGFRGDVVRIGALLSDAARRIDSGAAGVAQQAALNGRQAIAVASASRQTADGIAEVSASTNLVAEQVKAVEARLAQAKSVAGEAADRAAHGVRETAELNAAATEIEKVVAFIAGIASRVNMLAINATIEAARAGPAGRGFSIVAGEVKALATQTGEAARQIGARIGSVTGTIGATAASQQRISEIVTELNAISGAILGSAAEQSTATMQIASTVENAAMASAQISSYVAEMGERAQAAEGLAQDMGRVAGALAGAASDLGARVEAFLDELRAA